MHDRAPSAAKAEHFPAVPDTSMGSFSPTGERRDHVVVRDGRVHAGEHLIADFHAAIRLDEIPHMEGALREAVAQSGATLLHLHLHHFTPNGGISGVAVLAESHISVHTWPEYGYAAFDIFMCGDARPDLALRVLRRWFRPEQEHVQCLVRGDFERNE